MKEISISVRTVTYSKRYKAYFRGCVCVCVCVFVTVIQSCPIFCNPMDCSLPGNLVHGILQARILEWVAISFSREYFWPKDQTQVSCIGRKVLYHLSHQGSPLEAVLAREKQNCKVEKTNHSNGIQGALRGADQFSLNLLWWFLRAFLEAQMVKNLPAMKE